MTTNVNLLVTGGNGFIASNFIHRLLKHPFAGEFKITKLINVDAFGTNLVYYSGMDLDTTNNDLNENLFFKSYTGNINDKDLVLQILNEHDINIIYHFAAQSHVDASFSNSLQFVVDNVLGTTNLLECIRIYGIDKIIKFIHVSTDEVYGDIIDSDKESLVLKYGHYDPTNPYAASKASAELMAKSFAKSYGISLIITRSNNVFGKRQYPEKIIPKFIHQLLAGEKCTIHGNGKALRKYLYVEDAIDAYLLILEKGKIGSIYEMDSKTELSAITIANKIITTMIDKGYLKDKKPITNYIHYEKDRPYQDTRYIVNPETLYLLGWNENSEFDKAFEETIDWYVKYAFPKGLFSF